MIVQATEKDFGVVHKILSHKSIYPYISDDYCPIEPIKDLGLDFLNNEYIKVLMPNEDSVFVFTPLSMNMYIVHTNVLPKSRGKVAIRAGKEVVRWMFKNTQCTSIISFVPSWNKQTLIYGSLVGLKRIGIIEKSFKKNDIMYDQVIIGIMKGDL